MKSNLLDRNPTDFFTVLRNPELPIFRLQNESTPQTKLCDRNITIFSGASVKNVLKQRLRNFNPFLRKSLDSVLFSKNDLKSNILDRNPTDFFTVLRNPKPN